MGCGNSLPALPHILIIGGGYSGSYLAKLLEKQTFATVTLIDPKDAMVHFMAALRCTVEPEFLAKMFIPYDKITQSFIRSSVLSIDHKKKRVILKDGKIGYDHLVISTGISSSFPEKITKLNPNITMEEAITAYKNFNDDVKKSPRILVIGASSAAVQFVGEVKTDYPDKQVIIIDNKEEFISRRLSESVQNSIKEILLNKGAELFLNDKVKNLLSLTFNAYCKNQKVKTERSQSFEVDLCISLLENHPQTEFLKGSLGKGNALTSSGYIKTTPTLQVLEFPHIYAMGDVTDFDEEKIPFTAKQHALLMAKNLKLICDGMLPNQYEPAPLELIIPVGCYDGSGVVDSHILDGDETRDLMGTNLFTPEIWGDLGLKLP